MKIGPINIKISHCTTGVYLKWYFNGWHYYNFQNGYDISMVTESLDIQTSRMFSRISKVERPSKIKADYSYRVTLEGITPANIIGFTGILLAERVEQYEDLIWREVEITRGDHLIKDEDTGFYILNFEITRKELPDTPAVYQKSILLYFGDTLCDLDTDEIIPINKQVNDIAEMQDRQSDFTAQFRIRKTREMRALFELSGEVGATTTFPYQNQTCKLIQNGIEMITAGIMLLERVDDQYYYISILSGNLNLFKEIENLKLSDLLLPSTNHDWTIANQKASHDNDYDYLYPLCEPSDDGGIAPLRLAGNTVEMYGGWIWPFVKVKTIWDEIFADYWCEGDILTNDVFLHLWIPITNLKITKEYTNKYLYSVIWSGSRATGAEPLGFTGAILINGTEVFRAGHYIVPFTATYRIRVVIAVGFADAPTLTLYEDAIFVDTFDLISVVFPFRTYEIEYAAAAGVDLQVWTTAAYYYYYSIAIIEINDAQIDYGSTVTPRLHLPDISQIDFIKLICNMFGLIPDYIPRDRKIRFWNYSDLYDNIPIARDWSAYLSERDDEVEFKFGDYARNNYLKYTESDDVLKDNGRGTMLVDDETLPIKKDILEVPISTCDEVTIATTLPMTVSRIAFNTFNDPTLANFQQYEQEETIDARIVYCKQSVGQLFRLWDDDAMAVNSVDIDDPKIASSHEVAFSSLVVNYASLSRMLTKTNLRRAKFNLPVYEVAGLKHYIPIYLEQYKAYFYVNKINNYVPGKLCTIDLIKL